MQELTYWLSNYDQPEAPQKLQAAMDRLGFGERDAQALRAVVEPLRRGERELR